MMQDLPAKDHGPWKVRARRTVYQNPWIRLYEDQIISPRGNSGIYGWVQMAGAAGIVAIDDSRNVQLVGQHRFPVDRFGWEIPAGGLRPGEDPLVGAKRELREETGVVAKTWTSLGFVHPMNGVSNETFHLFLAEDLDRGASEPDHDEQLELRTLPLNDVVELVQRSEMVDAFTVVGIYRAWMHLQQRDANKNAK